MRHVLRRSRLLVVLLAALLAATVGSGALRPTATTVGAGLTLTATESSVGLTIGAQAVVAVTVSQPGSLLGPIGLSVTGAPAGVTLSYPTTVLSGAPAVITAFANANTQVGTYYLNITAVAGSSTATITVAVVVTLPNGFTMALNPSSRVVVDGASTTYALSINRGLLAGPIKLTVAGLPQFATATVAPGLSITGSTATVNVTVPTNVLPGTYLITVSGKALLSSATASAYLIVVPQTYPDFPLAGTPDRVLAPGSEAGAIDVAITNPFNATMTVTNLGVVVQGTTKPGCTVANYQAVAYGGPATLTIPPNSTRTLSALGVPRSQWPAVRMLNLASNQDVCQTALVNLKLSASGDGA